MSTWQSALSTESLPWVRNKLFMNLGESELKGCFCMYLWRKTNRKRIFVAWLTYAYLRRATGLNNIFSISTNLFRFFFLCLHGFIQNLSSLRFSFLVFSPKYWREIKTDLIKDEITEYVRSFLNNLSAKCSYLNKACSKIIHTIYSFKLW